MMKIRSLVLAFLILLVIGDFQPAMAQEVTTVSNLMSLLKEEQQKATYDVNLNAPFSKGKSGIKEKISTETGELSIVHTIFDVPGRNGMDLVLQAQYRNRDAKLFNEGTRSGEAANSYGETVIAYYDVFDQNGYWLKTGGLLYTTTENIAATWQNGTESWIFTGQLEKQSNGIVLSTDGITNATVEKSRALTAKYIIGAGWALDMPFLDVSGEAGKETIFVNLLDGTTYKADFTSKNGLEKYELRDLLFDKHTNFGAGNETAVYRLYFRDGDEFFFSKDGFLIGQRDRFRNTIRYYYEDVNGLKLLTKIEDTVDRVVKISYNDSGTIFTMGPKKVTLLKRLVPGQTNKYYLSSFIDPAGREIKYRYTFDSAQFDMAGKPPANNTYVNLFEVLYPTGAKTTYNYTRGRKNLGLTGNMEYFKAKERYDQNGSQVVNRLKFQYYNEPDGYPTYKDSNQIPDTYRYESRTTNSKGLLTRNIFDGRHLTITTQETGRRLLAQTDTVYNLVTKMPVKVRERSFNAQGIALEKVGIFSYDSRGNIIAENHPTKLSEYTSDERKVFYTYDYQYNLPLSKKYKQDAKTTIEVKYSLTSDRKELATVATYANSKLLAQESYSYDGNGNLITKTVKKTDSENVIEKYEFGPEYGHAYITALSTTVKDADGNVKLLKVSTSYDFITGNKTSITDGKGNVTRFEYDVLDRITKTINPDKTYRENNYDDKNNIAYLTDENRNQTIYSFDGLGKVLKVKDKAQNIELVNLKYDELENVTQEINPKKNYKEYTYDQAERLTKVGHYDSKGTNLSQTIIAYDEAFRDKTGASLQKITVTQKADPGKADLVTNYYFDSLDQLSKLGRVNGIKEDFQNQWYDYLGNQTEVLDLKGNRTKFAYDGLGRLTQSTNVQGKNKSYQYDFLGNMVATSNELGHTAWLEYDGLGKVIVQKAPFEPGINSISKNYYNEAGNLVKVVDPEGGVSNFRYNQLNLLTSVEKVLNSRKSNFTRYQYDRRGNRIEVHKGLESLIDQPKSIAKYEYDSLGRILSFTDPMGKEESYQYDSNSNLIKTVDRNGKKIEFAYDGLDRLVRKQAVFDGQLEKIEFSYDKLGNRTNMIDTSGFTKFEYDNLGRLSKARRNNGISMSYSYDVLNRKVGMILDQSGDKHLDINYEYDNLGNLTKAREQGRAVSYNYDDAYRLIATNNQVTGVETSYKYNQGGMLKSLINKQGDEILESFQYEYDKRGNQLRKSDKNGSTQYYYDAMSRLKTALLPDDVIQDYSYDSQGNLAELVETNKGGIKETAYSYNRNSQLLLQEENLGTESTQFRFEYDNNGNQVRKDELVYRNGSLVAEKNWNFRFDGFNQLREVTTPDGIIGNYNYNGDGLRTSKDFNGEITNFTWDGQDVILETYGDGMVKAKNFFGLDLVSRQTASDIYYYLFNGHGDVTSLLNEQGEIIKDYKYDPFGKEMQDQLPLTPGKLAGSLWRNEVEKLDNPFQYSGEYLDQETGNYYLRARYYDPQVQRFISEDSYAKNPFWTDSIYSFAENNPIKFIDPSGHAVTTWDQNNLSSRDQGKIQNATDAWNKASKAGDKAGMDRAHAAAEAIRNPTRRSKGAVSSANGDGNTVETKGTGKTGVSVLTPGTRTPQQVQANRQIVTSTVKSFLPDFNSSKSMAFFALGGAAGKALKVAGIADDVVRAGGKTGKLYHYTSANPATIIKEGLKPGASGNVFTTPTGKLSPLQAQLDLALPPNRGLPQHLIEIDGNALTKMGVKVPQGQQVTRMFNMPGGGTEVVFPHALPPEALRVLR